jgi:tetratricopeptide (TPR) repeat protein
MARRRHNWMAVKIVLAGLLAVVGYVGFSYRSMLNELDLAAADYAQGDLESALTRYDNVEQKIRDYNAMRLIPASDRQNLFLNQARLLYIMEQYDDAFERLEKENEITGITTDSRYFLLRGNIAFRKAVTNYQQSAQKDVNLLEENLLGAEDSIRESLQMEAGEWDAKHNYEFINNVRKMLTGDGDEKMKLLMEEEAKPQARELPPELAG